MGKGEREKKGGGGGVIDRVILHSWQCVIDVSSVSSLQAARDQAVSVILPLLVQGSEISDVMGTVFESLQHHLHTSLA